MISATIIGWIIAFHLFGVILWTGGLLVLSSMMAVAAGEVGAARERLVMAVRTLFRAANVGAAVTIGFGLVLLALEPVLLRQGWLHFKLLLVVGMIAIHGWLQRKIARAELHPDSLNAAEFRMLHGVASALVLGILLLVTLRP